MHKVTAAVGLLLLTAGNAPSASAAAWCAVYDPSTYNCGFHSYAQCLATIRGVGGYCRQNYVEGYRLHPAPEGRRMRYYR